jgi:transcriptional regulator of met regulon
MFEKLKVKAENYREVYQIHLFVSNLFLLVSELLRTAIKGAYTDQHCMFGKDLQKAFTEKIVQHVKQVIVRLANNYKLTEITNKTIMKLYDVTGKSYTYIGIRNLHVHAREYDDDEEVDRAVVKLVENARRVCSGK